MNKNNQLFSLNTENGAPILRLILLMTLLVAGCSGKDTDNAAATTIKNYSMLSPCERSINPRFASIVSESLCGTIAVWEDRESQAGRQIELNIMVIPAVSPGPLPDPIFFLAGGPGQAATEIGPYLVAILGNLRQDRDIILVDQRGTGKSNPLDCAPDDPEELDQMDLTLERVGSIQVDMMKSCLEKFDANPALYTTPIAMDDLNEVRETLGLDKINLIGGSYGTRAALVYLRRHSDTVRSVMIDGLAPTTMHISKNVAVDANIAFEKMLNDCAANPTCQSAFPDLRAHFEVFLARMEQQNINVSLLHPLTGEPIDASLNATLTTRVMRNILYDRNLTSLLPLAIEEAYEGRYQMLTTMGYAFIGEDMPLSLGMMASVLCAEDMQRSSDANDENLYFDNAIYRFLAPVCEFWPRGQIPANYFEPVSSDIPVLVSSGTLDPITPPKYGEDTIKHLSNAQHIIVPGVGHGTLMHGCMPDLIKTFIDELDPQSLDTACVSDMQRPAFFASMAGPVLKNVPGTGSDEDDTVDEAEEISP